jgi:hypothetical protein
MRSEIIDYIKLDRVIESNSLIRVVGYNQIPNNFDSKIRATYGDFTTRSQKTPLQESANKIDTKLSFLAKTDIELDEPINIFMSHSIPGINSFLRSIVYYTLSSINI